MRGAYHRLRPTRDAQRGLTLVELMVSLVIVSVAVAATLSFGMSSTSGNRVSRRMITVERSARVSLEILSDAIRNSNAGVTSGNLQDMTACSSDSGLTVTNNTIAPDELLVVYASGGVVTSIRASFDENDTQMTVPDASELEAGDFVIITDSVQGHLIEIQDVQASGSDYVLTVDASAGACPSVNFPADGYEPGSLVVRARINRFFIEDDASVGNIPTLMVDPDADGPMDPEPVAEGIEDMQIVVGADSNGDGDVTEVANGPDDDEWHYNFDGDSDPPAMSTLPPRALRITLVARSAIEDSDSTTSSRPAVEDRTGAASPDEFRRRILSTTVEIRNLDGSP
jgi:prepilin-type N-terminal cleavage/methylation domain-containing protein